MVPGALLLTIRHVFESSSRPMFELLLLTPAEMETDTVAAHWPVRFEAVAVFLATMTTAFVLRAVSGSEEVRKKRKAA